MPKFHYSILLEARSETRVSDQL